MTENELFELIEPILPEGAEWKELQAARQHRREELKEGSSMDAAHALLSLIQGDKKSASYYETWVPEDQCLSVFKKLHKLASATSYLPVILGAEGECGYCSPAEAVKILEAAEQIDGQQWILDQRDPQKRIEKRKERISELRESLEENPALQTTLEIEERMLKLEEDAVADGSSPEEPQMDWPEKEHSGFHGIRLRIEAADQEDDGICIALVPAHHPWQIPAFLDFGGWNSCPNQEVHCAVLKHWSESFGAELVMMESDTLQLLVSRPPATREEAWQLALDQNTYAEFEQLGALAMVSTLASALLNSENWFFWWD